MSNLTTREASIVDAIIRHAEEHYEHGWDTVVECLSRNEVADIVRESEASFDDAVADVIRAFADQEGLRVRHEYGNEVRAAGELSTTPFRLGLE